MTVVVETMNDTKDDGSPLRPFGCRLCLLWAIGLPFSVSKSGEVSPRSWFWLTGVLHMAFLGGLLLTQISFFYSTGFGHAETEKLFLKENISSWEMTRFIGLDSFFHTLGGSHIFLLSYFSLYILFLPNFVSPVCFAAASKNLNEDIVAFVKMFRKGNLCTLGEGKPSLHIAN